MLNTNTGNIVRTPTTKESRLVSPPISSALAALQPNPAGAHYDVIQPRVIALDLTNARTDFELPIGGTAIWVPVSSNATDLIQVKLDSASNDGVPLIASRGFRGVPFRKLYLTHAAIAAATLYLVVFNDSPDHPIEFR